MHLKNLTAQAALQLIGRFRQGRNIIFGAEIFSVGRQEWLRGADQVFQDIEHTGDSMVRFIRGSYGVGKTNFAARLFHSALKRGWVGAYIELSDKVKLHEFHQVFAEITQMLYQPKQINNGASSSATPVGLIGIFDELEQVMEETPARRRKAYTILRELIDNVDGENGMKSTCLYAAAPPGQFESQKGFIEVEALASRIQTPIVLGSGITDYMGTIINLDSAPLSEDERTELAKRLRAIHSIARSWDAPKVVPDPKLLRSFPEMAANRHSRSV